MRRLKNSFFSTLVILTFLLLAACQALAKPSPTIPGPQAITTEKITPEPTETSPPVETKEPLITSTPLPTPINVTGTGTPLPSNLAVIQVENVEQVQHIATWGIGSPIEIQLSTDGQVLAVGTARGLHFYDTQELYEIAFRKTPHSVVSLAFSQDNNFIAVGQVGGNIDIYDRSDFSLIKRLELSDPALPESSQLDCFFFQSFSKLVSVTRSGEWIFIHQWSSDNWEQITSFSIKNGLTSFINPGISAIGVIQDNSLTYQSLLYAEDHKRIDLPETFSEQFWDGFMNNAGDIAPTFNGEGLLINNGSSIIYWEISSEETAYELTDYPARLSDPCQNIAETCLNAEGEIGWVCQEKSTPIIETITLTPDDIMMLISRNDSLAEFRRIEDGLLAWEIESHYIQTRFSPGGEFFFGLREDGLIEKRSSENGTLLGTIEKHHGKLTDIAFSPNGGELGVGTTSGWINILDAENGQSLGLLEGDALALDFSPDGALLAAGLQNGTIRIFSLENGSNFDLEGHFDSVNDVKFSENGQLLLSGSEDCTISLWDIKDRESTQILVPGKEDPFQVLKIDYSPLENLCYLVGDISGLYAVKEDAKYSIEGLISVRDFAVSENKQTLAVTGSGTSIFTDIQEEGFFTSHLLSTKGFTLALNADGSLLVIASDQSLEFWSTENRVKIQTIQLEDSGLPGNKPINLVFSPDNKTLFLGYQNGLIEIFAVPN